MSDPITLERRLRKLEATLEALAARERSTGTGTVTSVGLTMPTAVFDVANSPVTGSGTLAVTFDNQSANTVFSGPSSGAATTPAFRALVGDDVPITATQVPYGSATGKLTSEADLAYIAADNELRVGRARLAEQATPATPASGFGLIYPKSDGHFYGLNDSGVERILSPIRGVGTSFPGSPATNELYYRTDLGLLCYYDGTRWLTVFQFAAPVQIVNRSISGNGVAGNIEIRQDYAPYVTRVDVGYNVSTTNNGSNYWTIDVRGINAAYGASSAIHSLNTSATAANTWTSVDTAPGTSATPTNRARFDVNMTKTGTPGNIECNVTVYYRLIVT